MDACFINYTPFVVGIVISFLLGCFITIAIYDGERLRKAESKEKKI